MTPEVNFLKKHHKNLNSEHAYLLSETLSVALDQGIPAILLWLLLNLPSYIGKGCL